MNTGNDWRARGTAILRDPCASDWLKEAIYSLADRDINDAARDAAILADLLREAADAHARKMAAKLGMVTIDVDATGAVVQTTEAK